MAQPARPNAAVPSGEEGAVPDGWAFRADQADHAHGLGSDPSADILFVNMTPGWHVTTGPAGIFYHPASTASGTYTVSAGMHLFDPGQRREAFGIFIGGTDLADDAQAYTYFMLRQGGQYLIKERTGEETRVLVDWTAHEAVKSFDASAGSSVLNTLAINVGAGSVEFFVNGELVQTLPVDAVRTDGLTGFRVNHALNLHISAFDVTEG